MYNHQFHNQNRLLRQLNNWSLSYSTLKKSDCFSWNNIKLKETFVDVEKQWKELLFNDQPHRTNELLVGVNNQLDNEVSRSRTTINNKDLLFSDPITLIIYPRVVHVQQQLSNN